jgi:CRISPR-associated protein Csx10
MIALTFEIYVREPLLVTRLEGDPNSAVSYPYVPGSAIRGALASCYLPALDFDLAGDPNSRRLFFDGSTRYLNAYPLDRLGARTLPTPLSWFREKGIELQDGEVYDFSVEKADYLKQPKSLGESFCQLFGEETEDEDDPDLELAQVEFTRTQWQINVHTMRQRDKGRATTEEGAVFRYQAIAAGERLGGVILVSQPKDVLTLKGLLTGGDLWLGKSRSGGYGRVCIENVREVRNWTETVTTPTDLGPGDRLVITFLSDAILRTQDGAYADRLTPDLLPTPLNAAAGFQTAFKRVVPLGGFNRKWGLPLYQSQAIQAGSVFVFDVTSTITAANLRQLETQGIGERRAEGFGRVAVNWHAKEPVLAVRQVEPEPATPVEISLSSDSQKLAQEMVKRLLRRELDRRLANHIHERDLGSLSSWPSNAQLSRLRAIALNALPSGDVSRLSGFLADDKLKARAREQYRGARIDGMRLLDWLRERLKKPTAIWQWLHPAGDPLPQIGDAQAELTDDLAREYTIRLVDGVLHRVAKERGNE